MLRRTIFAAAIAAPFAIPAMALAADPGGQIANAAAHAGYAAGAANIAGVQMHLHHTVNCLVGPKGADYDAKQMNPCANAGNGAIPDATDAGVKQKLEAALAKAKAGIAATDIAAAHKDAAEAADALKALK